MRVLVFFGIHIIFHVFLLLTHNCSFLDVIISFYSFVFYHLLFMKHFMKYDPHILKEFGINMDR